MRPGDCDLFFYLAGLRVLRFTREVRKLIRMGRISLTFWLTAKSAGRPIEYW
jgi:hypothetical protein